MRMSRVKGVGASKFGAQKKVEKTQKKPQLEEYISNRDYTGAIALMEFQRASNPGEEVEILPWLGYAAFHLGEYRKAVEAYQAWDATGQAPVEVHLYIACCLFYLQSFKEAMEAAKRGPANGLQNRILFHIAHRTNDEKNLMVYHQKLNDTKEDQLSLAAIHYLRSHF